MVAKIATLIDNFSTNDLATLWGASVGTVTWSSGQVTIKSDTSYDSGLQSTLQYDLTSSSIYINITPYIATSADIQFNLFASSGNGMFIGFGGPNNWHVFQVLGGVQTNIFNTTYNATSMAWWRIRESGGTVFFDTAPDGVTWTNQFSTPDTTFTGTFALTSLTVLVLGGDFGSDPAGTTTVFKVNTTSGTLPGLALESACPGIPAPGIFVPGQLIKKPSNSYTATLTGLVAVGGAVPRRTTRILNAIISLISSVRPGFNFFNQILPTGTLSSSFAGGTTDLGIQFNVTSSGYELSGYYVYIPTGGDTTASNYTFALYSTTNGTSGTQVGTTTTGSVLSPPPHGITFHWGHHLCL